MNTLNEQHKVKTWWSPVWRGLIVDPNAQHYRQMRNAIWLYTYFLIHADRKTGELWRKHDTIASDMGINIRTIRRWQERLLRHSYITVIRTGRFQVIKIQKWKTLRPRPKAVKAGAESGQRGAF